MTAKRVDPRPSRPLLVGENPDDLRRVSPTGSCHDCGQLVTGERKLCGRCVVRREIRRGSSR